MLEDQIGRTAPHIGSHEESTPTTLCVALSKPSPAQLLMGRRLRGMLTTQLTSDWTNFNLYIYRYTAIIRKSARIDLFPHGIYTARRAGVRVRVGAHYDLYTIKTRAQGA